MTERTKAATAVYLILRKEGKVLIALRVNTGYQDGNYQVPAGHIEPGELPKDALVREAAEELGIEMRHEDLTLAHVSFRPKHDESGDRVDFYFEATRWAHEVQNMEPHKCDTLRWVTMAELPHNMTPHVKTALLWVERGEVFSELSLDWMRRTGMYTM